MVEVNTILSFIQATGIIEGVAYYSMNIQNIRRIGRSSWKPDKHSFSCLSTLRTTVTST